MRRGDGEGKQRDYVMLTLDKNGITSETLTEKYGSDKGKMVPTDTGIVVNDFLLQSFPEIMDYNFTAHVEQEFDTVAEGGKDWIQLIRNFYEDLEPQVERIMNERTETRIGERQLGDDPKTGKPVSVKIGRFGPMVQLGGGEGDEEKPRFAKLPQDLSLSTITLEQALELFKLPRTLGEFEGATVKVGAGRFGPYVQHASKYVSIPKGEEPLEITLERAIELILAKREAEAKSLLRTFAEEPELEVRTGRFGPYIAYQGKNYKIPKAQAEGAAELSLEACREIIAAEGKKPAKTTRRTTKKKA